MPTGKSNMPKREVYANSERQTVLTVNVNFMGAHIIVESFTWPDESKQNAILSVYRISPIS